MKALIAKFLQWCLFKLGYTEVYVRKNEVKIFITCDASEALKQIERTNEAMTELSEKMEQYKKYGTIMPE